MLGSSGHGRIATQAVAHQHRRLAHHLFDERRELAGPDVVPAVLNQRLITPPVQQRINLKAAVLRPGRCCAASLQNKSSCWHIVSTKLVVARCIGGDTQVAVRAPKAQQARRKHATRCCQCRERIAPAYGL